MREIEEFIAFSMISNIEWMTSGNYLRNKIWLKTRNGIMGSFILVTFNMNEAIGRFEEKFLFIFYLFICNLYVYKYFIRSLD